MTSQRLKKLEDIVKPILEESPLARNDDMYLYGEVIGVLNPAANDANVLEIMRYYKAYGLPPLISVGRVRRKIQEKCPELASDRQLRRRQQEVYKEYAKTS